MNYKILCLLKQKVKMSMVTILENGNEYYIASDTRAIDPLGNIVDETRQKIVPLEKFPLVIVSTGIASFTKSNINLKDYISLIESKLDTTKDIYYNLDIINSHILIGINECVEHYDKPINAAMEIYYFYNNGTDIIPIYCIINNGIVITEDMLKTLRADYPKRKNNILKLGNDDIDYVFKRDIENYNLNPDNFPIVIKDFYTSCYKEYERIGLNYINNTLDIVKITPTNIEWLEKHSL